MTPPVRHADRPLDAARVRAAVAAQWPALRRARLERLGSGWDQDAWAVGPHRVALFPRRRGEIPRQHRAAAVLHRAGPALRRARLGAPRLLGTGRPCAAFPYPFLLVTRVPGRPAPQVAPAKVGVPGLADDLARALRALHATVPPLGVVSERGPVADFAAAVAAAAPRLAAELPAAVRRAAAPWLDGRAELPPPREGAPVLVHDDLGPEHLMLDPHSGRLLGIVDFGDAGAGDPAGDMAAVGAFFGWDFAAAVRARYGLACDEGFAERCVALARGLSLLWVAEAAALGDRGELPRLRAAAERAFATPAPFLAACAAIPPPA